MNNITLSMMSAEELASRLDALVSDERQWQVEFLRHLAELDRRQLHVTLGYPSLFAYCTQALRLTNASAFRRTTAARLMTRFPVIAAFLQSRRLCLTTLCLLKDVLDEANHAVLLERAAGRTEAEVKVLVATLRPQPAPSEMIRKLPDPQRPPPPQPEPVSGPEVAHANATPAAPPPRRAVDVKPISAELHVVRLTVTREFLDELDAVRDALSHKIPGRQLDLVLRECLRVTLDVLGRRKLGAPTERAKPIPETTGRTLPTELRRRVWARDAGQCTFVGTGGKRCGARHQLEFHHVMPYARGGSATEGNVTLLCKMHNQHQARADFGDEHMAQFDGRQTTLW